LILFHSHLITYIAWLPWWWWINFWWNYVFHYLGTFLYVSRRFTFCAWNSRNETEVSEVLRILKCVLELW